MKVLRWPLILTIFCLIIPFVGILAYKTIKTREVKKYDFVFDQPVTPIPVEIPPKAPFTNSVGMHFIYISPGRFLMGSPINEIGRDEGEYQHEVVLSNGYYLQTTEVTQAHWQTVLKLNPSEHKGNDLPVHNVSWFDSQTFIKRLNQLEGDSKYRLPSEAEWEYACRAGTQSALSTGELTVTNLAPDSLLDRVGWYKLNSKQSPHPVATKSPNAWGLYDMYGNVWEWNQDWWEGWYGKFSGTAVIDPKGPQKASFKVFRSGGWFAGATYQRCASRMRAKPVSKSPGIGFRVARSE